MSFSLIEAAFGGAICLSVAYMILTRNLVRAGVAFFLALLSVAGLFAFSGADYAAASQVVAYVGGVLLLVLFGLMLSGRMHYDFPASGSVKTGLGVVGATIVAGLMFVAFESAKPFQYQSKTADNSPALTRVQASGKLLLTDYLFVFETLSVFLLLALVGAAYISRKDDKRVFSD